MSHRLPLSATVSESMIHIIEPVATQAVKYILERLGIDRLMHEVHIISDFRDTSKTLDDNFNPKLIDYRCVARLTPSVNPRNNKWEGMKTAIDLGNGNVIMRQDEMHQRKRPWSGRDFTSRQFSIFHDDLIYTDLTLWNVGSTMTMEVKIDFHDLTPAQTTLSNIFAMFTDGDMIGYIPIQYDYPIPNVHQKVFRHLYKLSPYEQSDDAFNKWLQEKSAGQISWNVNRNNLNVREMVGLFNNMNALFLIECSQDAPEVGNNRFTINLTLTVQYSRVNRLIMDYPIIVNNNFLGFEWVPVSSKIRDAYAGPYQWQCDAVTAYWDRLYPRPATSAIGRVPWWDNWNVPEDALIIRKGFRPIYVAALTLDDADNPEGVTTIDIIDGLPGYRLRDDLIEDLKKHKNDATGIYAGNYVNISVFAHDYPVDYTLLDFDGTTLTLKSRQKSSIYRLVISVNPNPVNTAPMDKNLVWITTIIPKRKELERT